MTGLTAAQIIDVLLLTMLHNNLLAVYYAPLEAMRIADDDDDENDDDDDDDDDDDEFTYVDSFLENMNVSY